MKINKKIRLCYSEILISIVINKFEVENILNRVSDINSLKKNDFNQKFLCKILRFGNFKNFFGFANFKPQNEYLKYLIEEKWSYEILQAVHAHLTSSVENYEEEKVKEYFLNFSDIKQGLIQIYLNDDISQKISVITAKILIILCSYDDTAGSVEMLINQDIIPAISKKISSCDYSLLQINFLLLYVITDKIKSLKFTQLIAQDNLLFESMNNIIIQSKFYDNPMFIFENLIKVLFNLIASDFSVIQQKLLEQILLDKKNNIVNNFIDEFLICKLNFKDDYKSFIKRCKIEEKVYRFFCCVIKKNSDMKYHFINNFSFLKKLSENKIFQDYFFHYNNVITIFRANKLKMNNKHPNSIIIEDFIDVLRVLYRLFQFIFFLYENYRNDLLNLKQNEEWFRDFYKLFETINAHKDEEDGIIKLELTNAESLLNKTGRNEFKDFGSTLFSLQTLLVVEDDGEI